MMAPSLAERTLEELKRTHLGQQIISRSVRRYLIDQADLLSLLSGNIRAIPCGIPDDAVIVGVVPQLEYARYQIYVQSSSFEPFKEDDIVPSQRIYFIV